MITIAHAPIDLADLFRIPGDGASGGVVSFVGTVRDHTAQRRVVRLEYEAYEPMALRELEAVARAATDRFALDAVTIVHRVGILLPGEVAVAILVRAAHRAAAFDGCRFTIDTLKQTVPIWKKEVFADGETWVGDRP